MKLPKTASNKVGTMVRVQDIKKLERLAASIATPFQKLLDQDSRDLRDSDEIMLTEKVSLDVEKAWAKMQDACRIMFMKKIKKTLGSPQRVYQRPDPFPPKNSAGESKSRGKATSDAKGSTSGPGEC